MRQKNKNLTITCTRTAISVTSFAAAKVVPLMASGDVGVMCKKK